ncbi:hypothetical protein EVAR_13681_1 [Eumeta japonica]|uniref:Uncharacterized protein n=1 Tax=Eumeta variegata TaxID=151549 RepID=A0A4C1UCS0_EUMVA|nr:hypothetical protein EVAR_13681_1 [Eumeta japonica]
MLIYALQNFVAKFLFRSVVGGNFNFYPVDRRGLRLHSFIVACRRRSHRPLSLRRELIVGGGTERARSLYRTKLCHCETTSSAPYLGQVGSGTARMHPGQGAARGAGIPRDLIAHNIPSQHRRLQGLLPRRPRQAGLAADGGTEEALPDPIIGFAADCRRFSLGLPPAP